MSVSSQQSNAMIHGCGSPNVDTLSSYDKLHMLHSVNERPQHPVLQGDRERLKQLLKEEDMSGPLAGPWRVGKASNHHGRFMVTIGCGLS